MGSLATNGYYQPKNMLHILLDNEISLIQLEGKVPFPITLTLSRSLLHVVMKTHTYIHSLDELESENTRMEKTKGLLFYI